MKNPQALLENEIILSKDQEILDLKNKIEEMKLLLRYYEEQFLLSRRKLFGSSSEKSNYDGQITLAEALDEYEGPDVDIDSLCGLAEHDDEHYNEYEEQNTHVPRCKKRTRKEGFPKDVPVQEVIYELTEEERMCPSCDATAQPFGSEYREELVVVPARIEVRRHVARKYICRQCQGEDHPAEILKADMPEPVIRRSFASPEAIAHTAYQKFVLGVPLYRQEKDWERKGVMLSRQTLANWLITVSKDYLNPLFKELKRQFLEQDIGHADETTFQVLREEGRAAQSKSYLWLYKTSIHTENPIVLAEYKPSREHLTPAVFLDGFKGFLHTDGYDAYHKLPEDVVVVGCWAHVRRKWDEALKVIKNPMDREGTYELKGKKYCDKLFSIEKKLASLAVKDRHMARKRHENQKDLDSMMSTNSANTNDAPKAMNDTLESVMDEFFEWAYTVRTVPKSALGRAIKYTLSQKKYLKNVLMDGRLELSNNCAERAIRPFVISRKNFLFANTPNGASAAATIFSLIETAKAINIDPFEYLAYVFKTAPNLNMKRLEDIKLLLPAGYKKIACNTSSRV